MRNYKIYKEYKKHEDLLLKYQMCRAYLRLNCSIKRLVEVILTRKFRDDINVIDVHNYRHFLNAINATNGKRNGVVNLPRLGFNENVENILAEFIRVNFDKMVESVKADDKGYPYKFRDIVEINSF